MAIDAIVDSLDNVPAHFHELYTAQGDKFVITGVTGVKPLEEFTRVHGGLTKERNDHKATKALLDTFKVFGDPTELQTKLDRMGELELAAAGKLDEKHIDQLVTTRLTAKTAPLERERDTLKAAIGERDTLIQQFQARETQRTIIDSLREALKKHEGFQVTAFDDAAMLAERVFMVDEDGRVVTKDNVGTTPGVDPAVWLTEMQQKRPHWWGPSQGSGAPGNQGGQGGMGGKNPFTHDNWNVTEQNKMFNTNPKMAEQMASAAGTRPGGTRPAPRK